MTFVLVRRFLYLLNVTCIKPILFAFLIVWSTSSVAKNSQPDFSSKKKDEIRREISASLFKAGKGFEVNTGQHPDELKFRYGNPSANVDFYEDRIVFSLRKLLNAPDFKTPEDRPEFEYTQWEIELKGVSTQSIRHFGAVEQSNINRFDETGKRIRRWHAERIAYEEIYPNINLVFYTSESGALKYDFILKAGANLQDIQLKYHGVENLSVDIDGKLSYVTDWGIIREDAPISYIQSNGETVEIEYKANRGVLGFTSQLTEITETIVLDPIYVDWSGYFYGEGNGGMGWAFTWVLDLDIDDSNCVYVTGMTTDAFPYDPDGYDTSRGGIYDAYVCKLTPAGDSMLWFSYLGGASYEYSFSMTVNSQHEPVIAGITWGGSGFPTTPGAFDSTASGSWYSGFITKFGNEGDSLIFSTFLGGSASTLVHSLTMDNTGNVFLAGETKSTDFPTTTNCFDATYNGASNTSGWWNGGDAFLTKLKSDGSDLLFSTYIGGANDDIAYDVELSPSGEIYVAGKTASGNFPVTAGSSIFNYNVRGSFDGFIMKFRSDGKNLAYSKLMGGDGVDWFESVYVNDYDEAYIGGISESTNFYTTTRAYQKSNSGGADFVIVKMNPLGQNVMYSTYVGGSGNDRMNWTGWIYNSNISISANVREEAIICGVSVSSDFPTTTDALMQNNPSAGGSTAWYSTAVIAKLDYLGEKLLYGTYYGGTGYEFPGANKLKRISCYTNILYGGITGSQDYPTTTGVFRDSPNTNTSGGWAWSGFISKFRDTLYTDLIELSLTDTLVDCDHVYEIMDIKNQGADILWSTGGTGRFEILQDTGEYWVQATYGCDTVRDTVYVTLEYSPVIPALPSDTIYCDNFPTVILDAGNDSMLATYVWSTADSTQTVTVNKPNKYWVRIETPNCGEKTDSINMRLLYTPDLSLPDDSVFCDSVNIMLSSGLVNNEELYSWNTGDSTNTYHALDTGYYQLNALNFCGEDSTGVQLDQLFTPLAVLPADTTFCDNVDLTLYASTQGNNNENLVWTDITNAQSISLADSIQLNAAGHYALAIGNKCGVSKDSIQLFLRYTPNLFLGNDSVYCDTLERILGGGRANNDEIYLWDDNGNSNTRYVNTEGTYWLEISNLCGTVRDSITFTQRHTPTADIVNSAIGSVPDSVFCDAVYIALDAAINRPDATYLWSTGQSSPQITANSDQTYWVRVSGYCGEASDTVNFGLISSPVVELGEERVFCGSMTPFDLTVGTANNEEIYLWSDQSTAASYTVNTDGLHWVQIENKCATVSDTLSVRISPYLLVDLGPDTSLCGNFSLTLDAGNPGMEFLWEPFGEQTQTITADEQRVYRVRVTNPDGCVTEDEMEITPDCISYHHIPNAFTPNADGHNDEFKPTLINYERFSMRIYNRWGELVFESDSPDKGWNGMYRGEQAPQGVYVYVMHFVTTEDLQAKQFKGTLHLLR